ncbi:hypothetical protein BC936DRAFT_140819 [Jimgerdemannia flammicorona]|uniref:Uncharacterized protein n=1 Tax=Jimgerdemannia flammicorona TaxID=994334 RepID=A0A433DGJ1_9FUNG|nr:hypothetical protein BC936DRAFT_140819 [Jimgerdemannia flammicorona]
MSKEPPRPTTFSFTIDDYPDQDHHTYNYPFVASSSSSSSSSTHHLSIPLYHSDTASIDSIDSSTALIPLDHENDTSNTNDRPFLTTIREEEGGAISLDPSSSTSASRFRNNTILSSGSSTTAQALDELARLRRHATWRNLLDVRKYFTLEHVVYAVKNYYIAIAWFIVSFVMFIIIYKFRKDIFVGLENLAMVVRGMGVGGYLLISFLIFLSAFPPMVGYGTFQTLAGFTFGFGAGVAVGFFSALTGGVTCFVLCRMWFKKYVRKIMAKNESLEAVVKAVERKGLKNVLFSATDIPLLRFFLGTALSLVKLAAHVYIGANLKSFSKHILGEDPEEDDGKTLNASDAPDELVTLSDVVRYVAMGVGFVLATGVMLYVWLLSRRIVREAVMAREGGEGDGGERGRLMGEVEEGWGARERGRDGSEEAEEGEEIEEMTIVRDNGRGVKKERQREREVFEIEVEE